MYLDTLQHLGLRWFKQDQERKWAELPEYHPDEHLLFFAHIIKTSGTSLRYTLVVGADVGAMRVCRGFQFRADGVTPRVPITYFCTRPSLEPYLARGLAPTPTHGTCFPRPCQRAGPKRTFRVLASKPALLLFVTSWTSPMPPVYDACFMVVVIYASTGLSFFASPRRSSCFYLHRCRPRKVSCFATFSGKRPWFRVLTNPGT